MRNNIQTEYLDIRLGFSSLPLRRLALLYKSKPDLLVSQTGGKA